MRNVPHIVLIEHAINVGRTLGGIRLWRGMDQSMLAQKIGWDRPRTYRMERFGMYLDRSSFEKICRVLDVDPQTVLDLERLIRISLNEKNKEKKREDRVGDFVANAPERARDRGDREGLSASGV